MSVNPENIKIRESVFITLDGKKIHAEKGETIFNVAKKKVFGCRIYVLKTE